MKEQAEKRNTQFMHQLLMWLGFIVVQFAAVNMMILVYVSVSDNLSGFHENLVLFTLPAFVFIALLHLPLFFIRQHFQTESAKRNTFWENTNMLNFIWGICAVSFFMALMGTEPARTVAALSSASILKTPKKIQEVLSDPNLHDYRFVSLTDYRIHKTAHGEMIRDNQTDSEYEYDAALVAPLTSKAVSEKTLDIWICEPYLFYKDSQTLITKPFPDFDRYATPEYVYGLVVTNRQTYDRCFQAMDIAINYKKLEKARSNRPVFIQATQSYDPLLAESLKNTVLFLSVVNLIWVIFPLLLGLLVLNHKVLRHYFLAFFNTPSKKEGMSTETPVPVQTRPCSPAPAAAARTYPSPRHQSEGMKPPGGPMPEGSWPPAEYIFFSPTVDYIIKIRIQKIFKAYTLVSHQDGSVTVTHKKTEKSIKKNLNLTFQKKGKDTFEQYRHLLIQVMKKKSGTGISEETAWVEQNLKNAETFVQVRCSQKIDDNVKDLILRLINDVGGYLVFKGDTFIDHSGRTLFTGGGQNNSGIRYGGKGNALPENPVKTQEAFLAKYDAPGSLAEMNRRAGETVIIAPDVDTENAPRIFNGRFTAMGYQPANKTGVKDEVDWPSLDFAFTVAREAAGILRKIRHETDTDCPYYPFVLMEKLKPNFSSFDFNRAISPVAPERYREITSGFAKKVHPPAELSLKEEKNIKEILNVFHFKPDDIFQKEMMDSFENIEYYSNKITKRHQDHKTYRQYQKEYEEKAEALRKAASYLQANLNFVKKVELAFDSDYDYITYPCFWVGQTRTGYVAGLWAVETVT